MERGGGGGELDQSHLPRKMGFDEKRAGVRKLVLSYWTLLSAEDIFCGHHPTLHLMIKKVLVRFDLMDPYLGDKHSVLE